MNLIQAHKALDTASKACMDGGKIIFLAECAEGLGRQDFLNWFEAKNSQALAEKLCKNYQVNGQTAWSLLQKAERFDIKILTSLPENVTDAMRMRKANDLTATLSEINQETKGYILPFGAKFEIKSFNG
jgi:nickel-dependent lactate racemase